MTNLIAKVAELREMEARAEGIEYFSIGECELNYGTVEFLENMRIAAPELLAALGKVQAGDSKIIDLFVAFMERFKPDGHLNDIGPGAKITNAKAAACLRRYADLARLMESTK